LTEELFAVFGREIESVSIQPGPRGVFEVTYNGDLLFSKRQTARFPDPGEVVNLIKQRG
jgi:selenoprotein W-related protein